MRARDRIVALVVAAALAMPVEAIASPAERERIAEQAAAHQDRGEHREAAQAYAQYYRLLDAKARADVVGENAVLVAVEAYQRAFEETKDRADLEGARALLVEHLDHVEKTHGRRTGRAADRAAFALVRVEADLLKVIETESPPDPEDPAPADPGSEGPEEPEPDEPPPAVATRPEPPRPDVGPASVIDAPRPTPRRDKVGIALTATGGPLLAGGIVLIAIGATLPGRAQRRGESVNLPEPQLDEYTETAKEHSLRYLIPGGILAGAGAALLAYGITRLVRQRRRASTARR